MERVLIVEDADSLREVLKSVLETEGYLVDAYVTGEEALEALKGQNYECILADFKLPGINGLELLSATREITTKAPYVIMTAYGSIEIAVEAMKRGANDFLCKPFEPSTLCSVVRDIVRHRQIVDRRLGTRNRRDRRLISEDPSMQVLLHQARQVAPVDTSVLICGESGTGKELLARYVHEHSNRRDEAFVAVNCAAMPADLLESEFFGHEAGSFTGATQTRQGVFEIASKGTIFLDEVGDMSTQLQVKLLRALQEGEIKRVGGNKVIKVNPRVLAATNHDVEKALEEGRLREDFYYRVAVVTFDLPPLRDRKSDVKLLAQYFVDYFSSALGKGSKTLSPEVEKLLLEYAWPGNARELENVIERAAILAGDTIQVEHLGLDLSAHFDSMNEVSTTLPEVAAQAVRKAESDMIERVLHRTRGNKSKAAQLLGVSYKTLLNKVKEYEISYNSPV